MSPPSQLSFFDLATRYDALSHHGDPLESLASHVPWWSFGRPWKKFSAAPSASKAVDPPLMPC